MADIPSHTPGPWHLLPTSYGYDLVKGGISGPETYGGWIVELHTGQRTPDEAEFLAESAATCRLIAAAPELYEAAKTHLMWIGREREGPLYPAGMTRDSTEGEKVWRAWWEDQLRLCDLTEMQCRAAIAKAEGVAP